MRNPLFANRSSLLLRLIALSICVSHATSTYAQVDLDGLVLVQEGPAASVAGDPVPDNLSLNAEPFASSDLGPEIGTPYHFTENINDGSYGNEFSWIGGDDNPFFDAFAGIDLGDTPVSDVQSIAFGRSNVLVGDAGCGGGVCMDRHLGFYILQYTQFPNPSSDLDIATTGNPVTGWVDIGTLDYVGSEGPDSNFDRPWLRHRYNFDPVDATGVRLIVPGTGLGGGTAIDEIELYDMPGEFVEPPPPPPPFVIDPAEGFGISWDGNEGEFFDEVEPPDGAIVPDNAALASRGATPFANSDLGPELGIDFHVAENLNDGFYGNSNSWIGGDDNPFAPEAFAGITLAEPAAITSVAWGRDNGNDFTDACGGQCTDRSTGTYTLQFTRAADPDEDTQDTGNADTGWETIGEITFSAGQDDVLPYLRHEFEVTENGQGILASGFRLLVPGSGLGGGTAIDEIEIYIGQIVDNPCDLNGDGVCDVADIDLLTAEIDEGSNDSAFDLNQDGSVDLTDRETWVRDLQGTWFGDANLDGEFNSTDFVTVFQAGKFETQEVASWSEGDWNGDREFNSSDFVSAFQDGGFEQGPRAGVAAVPEPSAWVLLLLGIAGFVTRRRV